MFSLSAPSLRLMETQSGLLILTPIWPVRGPVDSQCPESNLASFLLAQVLLHREESYQHTSLAVLSLPLSSLPEASKMSLSWQNKLAGLK